MKIITSCVLKNLAEKAGELPRKRAHLNIHDDLNEPIHRLCIAVEPGSYVRVHRHLTPPKHETLVILSGKLAILVFDKDGSVSERIVLSPSGDNRIVDIEAGAWHTFASLESGTSVMEIKPGPYVKPIQDDFASWAPEEGTAGAPLFEKWYTAAQKGDSAPADQGAKT